MTEKEFILKHREFQEGMIKAYSGIRNHCDTRTKAHIKELTHKRIQRLVEMNKHLWEEK